MFCVTNAVPTIASGMEASAAHSAGRHRRDNSLPSGKTSGSTIPPTMAAGANVQVFAHSAAVANGSEPGPWASA
jgi:hypothetical protein